ncbi:DUF4870 domain-containing protein [Ornithinimicrobium sediminis]|uniref:DUF4870 domain-containing protein n=1 Tax=Ornithinimicrobium sediminis TaxID=2904603 RepID=UPI001E4D81D4|nr:DUF4870 domain-containing protein [Ornithinimicrobium sediminis]MCE0486731.1 DUF4870 domain-containing protein [Ornithinimicrobium sediminis]
MSTTPPPPPPQPDDRDQETEQHDGEHTATPPEQQPYESQPQHGEGQQQYGTPPHEAQQQYGEGQQQYGEGQQQYGTQQPQFAPAQAARPLGDSEERTWAIFSHLSAPIAFLLSAGSLNFLGPLIIWAIFKDRSQLVRTASAGSFNFNVTIWIINAVAGLIAVLTLGLGLLLAIPVWITTFVVAAVLHIMAAIKASNGEAYTYPLQIPILK